MVNMTKRKPDKVIEYRFSLQDKERQMLDSYVAAHSFNSVTTPIVTLMNDMTGMAVFLELIAGLGLAGVVFIFSGGPYEDMPTMISDWLFQRDQAAAATGITLVGRGPLWGTIDLFERLFGINIPDVPGGYEPPEGGGGGF